ncbi:hypothetical protein AGABI1DRAFT_77101 [Agaricus bisporus var. burnettii JB137-S8]|uniref:Glycosyl transferase CAP10 domain-containing protein n=1 Tax=Agaricus bisporus var. burnettii (strain JB137-S8 / ATCC MYA-4627 / FGSC 10392) TaxID=597362 RepID=K5X386_AGABU|nr:uncharacterized protein AGABI1DRAFT_77101 [Agaricus bisporus var. burnettii JB137-S8]EKM77598.1 hypothetical protein AGABI1DRAFT_77101 [Agaricus bisporus var. burnettii JB137-S8]
MPAPRFCRRSTSIILAGIVISLVLFYPYREDGQRTPNFFFSTAFTTVVTTVTLYKTTTAAAVPTASADARTKLEKHFYRGDGLLEVNYGGAHPIFELVRRAERDWEDKLKRASKTLVDAVKEYRRRYNRDPPKGFDIWWKYVTEHNVQLPDEYDQIFHDLEPFWGLEPSDLFKTQAELETRIDSYTIGKQDGSDVDVLTYAFTEGRYDQLIAGSKKIIALLSEIQHLLPDFRMTISPHDGPNFLSDWEIKRATLEAAAAKTYLERETLPKVTSSGWITACPPRSLARRIPINLDIPFAPSSKKTFIYNHRQTMDPCIHPSHFYRHGQFLSHNNGPRPQSTMIPEFSYCATTLHHNIRIPVPYGWVEDVTPRDQDPDFDDKVDDRLLWRGSNTGIFHASSTRWKDSHRDFLVRTTNDFDGSLDMLMPTNKDDRSVGNPRKLKKSVINPTFFDIAFSKEPISCSKDVCPVLEEIYPWRPYMKQAEAGTYRYVLDVDGNGWSGRFKRLITSNSLIFKSTIYPEWYTDRISAWVHYVPVQVDLSDLHDCLVFFRGDGNGEGSHDDLGKKIAKAGREWSLKFWRREDINAYFFRLILEYARLMSPDRAAMSYTSNF